MSTSACWRERSGSGKEIRLTSSRFSVFLATSCARLLSDKRMLGALRKSARNSGTTRSFTGRTATARATLPPANDVGTTAARRIVPTMVTSTSPPVNRVRGYCAATPGDTCFRPSIRTWPSWTSLTRTSGTPSGTCLPGCSTPYAALRLRCKMSAMNARGA